MIISDLVLMLKNIDKWILSYAAQGIGRIIRREEWKKPTHIMFALVDHFEPDWHGADEALQLNRVQRWFDGYPNFADGFKDADGRCPQHTFFYPAECYTKEHLDLLAELCHRGYGEVEIHLHHDNDTPDGLRRKLEKAKNDFASHGLLSKRSLSDQIRFGFIHGNWALNNSRKDGRWCGVNHETHILGDAGCYADFTFPSAPSETQPKIINSIYYTRSTPKRPKSHNKGIKAKVGSYKKADLLLVQGPLTLNWQTRKWGIFPRIENGELSAANPPTEDRVNLWIDQRISVRDKPDWIFVKVYTHGAVEKNADLLLGKEICKMHQYLNARFNDGENFILHYMTAREMYNIIKAAEAGETGLPGEYRDYILEKNKMS